jgi:hypothetical protein
MVIYPWRVYRHFSKGQGFISMRIFFSVYEFDSFISSIYSKARVQISRLAGVLHAMSLASAVFDSLILQNRLPKYHDKSKETLNLLSDNVSQFKRKYKWQIISKNTAIAAISMMNYYLKQKKIYANRKYLINLMRTSYRCSSS